MDASGFLSNVIAGIVASVLTVAALEVIRRLRLRNRHRMIAGRYVHCSLDGSRLLDGVTELTYVSGTQLRSRGSGGNGPWEGHIAMSNDLTGYGTGTYQYSDRNDCGVLEVQVNQQDGSIYVRGMNTSHGKDKVFTYLWRPERLSTAHRPESPTEAVDEAVSHHPDAT